MTTINGHTLAVPEEARIVPEFLEILQGLWGKDI
jgi:hypothetical protein